LSGDRDTPTEMFVKGRHDAQLEAPSRDTPTRGIPMPTGGPSDSQGLYGGLQPPNDEDDFGTMRFNPDAPPGQALPPTPAPSQSGGRQASEMLGTMRLPESAEVAEVRASLASKNILGVPGAPHNQPDIRATARLPQDGQHRRADARQVIIVAGAAHRHGGGDRALFSHQASSP
jgi:hypothetical protein